jgi:hypothetical protein
MGMHDIRPHQHGPQRRQHSEKKSPPLEDPRIHKEHEQRCSLCGLGPRATAKDGSRKHGPLDMQKHVSKPAGIPSSGQKKEEVHKTRPFNFGPLKLYRPLRGLTARRGHQARSPRLCSTRPYGIDRPAGRPKAARPCLNDL